MNFIDDTRLFELYELYHNGLASEAETTELMQLLEQVPDEKLSDLLLKTWNRQDKEAVFFTPATREKFLQTLHPAKKEGTSMYQLHSRRNKLFVRIAVAAAVLLVVSATALFFLRKDNESPIAGRPAHRVVRDIAPGGDKALLTLADGRTIVLDTAGNGGLTEQGGVKVIKIGGQLTYTAQGSPSEVLYNTITTPKGGQYQLELADGSRVWLNAASSLRFPAAFTGQNRTVELTGEAYFEVAHDPQMPFHVKVNDMDVEVLGTHFNVNSYNDEPAVKTTLLKGRVQVRNKGKHVFLNPGQQAVVQPEEDNIRIAYDVDLEEVIAWKNGRFQFNATDIETVMRQVARWYDVGIIYEGKIHETLSGGLPRSQNVSQLLKILEATGKVEFTIKDKIIIVRAK